MRITELFGLVALVCSSTATTGRYRNHDSHEYYALHLESTASPLEIASSLGLDYEGQLGELPDHHTFSSPRHRTHGADEILQELRRRRRRRDPVASRGVLDGILWSQKQKLKPRMQKRALAPPLPGRQGSAVEVEGGGQPVAVDAAVKLRQEIAMKLDIHDPIFDEQWHLYNAVQLGHDVNVTSIWMQGITGHNATVVMVDDGIDMYSDDLKDNYFAEGSYDFNDHTDEPRPRLSDDRHGTRCAGEIAAVRNSVCGVGVAYDAKVAGIRILSKAISDEDEAVAMNFAFQQNQIYSCSWGPPDDGRSMDAPGILIKRAMLNAVQNGRQGKGSIYVFAAGNGAAHQDNCNFDGYTNSIYSITVGAIDRKGLHPYYSEKCSAQLVVTYSSGSNDAIHTTDVGTNQCYANHGGTSAAAPLGAGIFALVLSIRQDLSWRDMQYLCVLTAVPVNLEEEWVDTYIGRKYSHTYGYGKLDTYAIVEAAKTFTPVKPQAWYYSPWLHVNHAIPQGDQGLASSFEVTKEVLQNANLERLEHVTVTMNVPHARRGDLSVELRSPENVVSYLSTTRNLDDNSGGYVDWTFMSVMHWGESGIGTWTVVVKDTNVNEHNGTFTDWRLNLWGECIDGSQQSLLPMPTEHDDDNHDVMSAIVSTTTLSPGSSETGVPGSVPSDHIDRPVNAKPSTTSSASPTSTASPSSSVTTMPDNFLPGFLPTFGVSKKTQIWIYGALAMIIIFCGGLGIYFYVQRRKRLRNSRDEYEFEMLDDAELDGGANGTANGKRVKRRAGELYDAFAGESDEELLSDEEEPETEYKDEDPTPEEEERGRSSSRDEKAT
ncbi:pheromone processing endoprotease [Hypocenomyce scalaris]|nr:pheromone processing endoprotease [Hypocenomyce scalaris]